MYQPKKYKKQDPEYIFKFIQQHPFATFVIQQQELQATHIPVLVEGNAEDFRLFSHIANHNELFSALKNGAKALLIFQGNHAYVSSSWYAQKDISTWDYSAVPVSVEIELQTTAELENSLEKLVNHFEKDQDQPLFYKNLPKPLVNDHLPLITGFWAKPLQINAIAKHHQGSSNKNVKNVIQHLSENGNTSLAQEIKKENLNNN